MLLLFFQLRTVLLVNHFSCRKKLLRKEGAEYRVGQRIHTDTFRDRRDTLYYARARACMYICRRVDRFSVSGISDRREHKLTRTARTTFRSYLGKSRDIISTVAAPTAPRAAPFCLRRCVHLAGTSLIIGRDFRTPSSDSPLDFRARLRVGRRVSVISRREETDTSALR